MESKTAKTHAPAAPAGRGKDFITRELNGSTFLTLEHVGHMVLVVLVPMLVLVGLMSALSMWTGAPGVTDMLVGASFAGGSAKAVEAVMALGVVAALLVLVPLLALLDRRTRAEWQKRPGYAGRLAYKAPLYTALAVLGTVIVVAKIQLLYVIIASLAFVGVPNAPIGSMYLTEFLPALATLVVAAATAWYLFKLAKGQDNGRMFSMGVVGLSTVMALALFITSITLLHSGDSSFTTPGSSNSTDSTYDSKYYQDLLNKYYQ